VTKVLLKANGLRVTVAVWLAVCGLLGGRATAENPPEKPAEALYLKLGQVGLDPDRVYQVRGASLDRAAIHITLEDGTLGFTEDVMGRITGAFFEGYGEVLLTPPNEVERRSMSLFTGMAILEEHFATAYFRFNDDVANELRPDLRATDNKREFVDHWGDTVKNMANGDATRLLMTFSRMLPVKGDPVVSEGDEESNAADHFLHARLQGTKFGVFDIYFDSTASEQVQVGQAKSAENGTLFYDVWTSFSTRDAGASKASPSVPEIVEPPANLGRVEVRRYAITTEVQPPKRIHAQARVQMEVREGGPRTLLFELSRSLQVESVQLNGEPVEYIHNPAVEGTQLARRGNDLVAVVLPGPARAGQKIDLEFVYGGEVLAEAGGGLLYVGARGTWYPNRGMAMADYDLNFEYPQGWTLVATGKATPASDTTAKTDGMQRSRWVSERPIPFAGFNLGKYKAVTVQAGDISVETYATTGVERNFPTPPIQVLEPGPGDRTNRRQQFIVPKPLSPVRTEATVGEAAARAIQYYAARFGPYPYSHLALTQMPGPESQGWPGLVFLSSYAFLDQEQREQLRFGSYRALLEQIIPAHETAHQWWGDLITWSSYRDQWFSEGLSNYCALMMMQESDSAGFREVMDKYRSDLVAKTKDGMSPMEAGPVTLGIRLLSSRFPEGYEAISYGRGTWLFHMLRTMLDDAVMTGPERKKQRVGSAEDPFVRGLRKIRERYEGRSISTEELLAVFAEDLPPSLRFEGKSSLDWFLKGWINGTSLPRLELRGVKFTPKGVGSVVSGSIRQKDAPADLVTSVPIYALAAGKQLVLLGRVFADGEESSFHLPAPAGTNKIVLDPNGTILSGTK
jgi:hypothetical protein